MRWDRTQMVSDRSRRRTVALPLDPLLHPCPSQSRRDTGFADWCCSRKKEGEAVCECVLGPRLHVRKDRLAAFYAGRVDKSRRLLLLLSERVSARETDCEQMPASLSPHSLCRRRNVFGTNSAVPSAPLHTLSHAGHAPPLRHIPFPQTPLTFN